MRHTKRITATLAGTLLASGCASAPTTPETIESARQGFIGDWAGFNINNWRMETRVESIADDGRATGTICLRGPRGGIVGGRLEDGRTRVNDRKGRIMQARFGTTRFTTTRFTMRTLPNDTLAMTHRRPDPQDKTKTDRLHTRLDRTEALQCAHLFAPAGNELDPEVLARTDGITGYWTTGELHNYKGNVLELAVLEVLPGGKSIRGYRCLADHEYTNTRISLIGPATETGPDPLLRGTWDHKTHTLSLAPERKQWGITGTQRGISKLEDPPGPTGDRLHTTAMSHIGTEYETTESFTLRRGTHPRGCLATVRTTQPEDDDQGSENRHTWEEDTKSLPPRTEVPDSSKRRGTTSE